MVKINNLFIVSDSHWNHRSIITLENRPFSTIEEHDETLIHNWNSVVKPKDEVWHLGDFSYPSKERRADYYLRRLNGMINMTFGNHDKDIYVFRNMLHTHQDMAYIKRFGQKLHLCHYSMRSWRSMHHGSWHIYGHSHGKLPPLGKSMDVGVMLNNYFPFSFDQVKEYMDKQPLICDHIKEEGND